MATLLTFVGNADIKALEQGTTDCSIIKILQKFSAPCKNKRLEMEKYNLSKFQKIVYLLDRKVDSDLLNEKMFSITNLIVDEIFNQTISLQDINNIDEIFQCFVNALKFFSYDEQNETRFFINCSSGTPAMKTAAILIKTLIELDKLPELKGLKITCLEVSREKGVQEISSLQCLKNL